MNRKEQILIVDDEAINLTVLSDLLSKNHYEARVAMNGHLALASVHASPPDLILLDIMMPGMDGYETCRQLQAIPAYRHIPIIFISALDDVNDKVKAFELGGVDYISKPFKHLEVLARIKSHLSIQQLMRENVRLQEETQNWAHTLEKQVKKRTQELQTSLIKEKAAREKLIQAGKLAGLGRMVASVAHELNNPLQTISNCLFLIQQKTLLNKNIQQYLNLALSETNRLSNLVEQLRQVYRPDLQQEAQTMPIHEIIEEVYKIIQHHLERRNVQWVFSSESKKCIIHAHRGHIKQVFLNLCLNAIDAMQPDGGVLKVEFSPDEEMKQVGISFQDTGAGISEKIIKNLFEPFFTTKESGMGLGLAISYDIVQQHGGYITVDSQLQVGSTFVVWLPISNAIA